MAEERLIDTDKDKKYRIRKNADGEDELYIDESCEEAETEEVTFVVEDDEVAEPIDSSFTDLKQVDEVDYEAEQKKEQTAALIASARKECEEGRFATAADYLEKAIELDYKNGEIYALEMVVYTRNFTDYSSITGILEYLEEFKKYTSKQTKQELYERASQSLEDNIDKVSRKIGELSEENDRQKAVRAKKFVADRNRVIVFFSIALAALCVFAGLSVYYLLNIHSVQTNVNLILAIVFTALAFVAFVFTAISLRQLLTALRRVRLNKKNTATQLGRELIAYQADLEAFNAVYEALKG